MTPPVPVADTPPEVGTPKATLVPSRKWMALVASGLGSIGLMYVTDMVWDATEWGALITLATGSVVSYLVPNAEAS